MESWLPRHRITVEEYYRMAEVGLLAPDARVELIEGEIIDMSPIVSRHGGTVLQLNRLVSRAAGDRALMRIRSPLRLSPASEPEPDIAVVKPRFDFYKSRHPGPDDTLLVVEVSDSTLRYDRQVKAPLDARHGIPEVWIVDLENEEVHFLRSPMDTGYAEVVSTRAPGVTALAALTGVNVDLSDVLKP
jgi:Uma2 family endonuclease